MNQMNEDEFKIRVSKLDAARRQLDCAIDLWSHGCDEIAIHTLASAAHEIIRTLCKQRGLRDVLFDTSADIIKPEYFQAVRKKLLEPFNFSKHADRDPSAILEFAPFISTVFMLASIEGLRSLGERLSTDQNILLEWLSFHYPDWLSGSGNKTFADLIPTNALPEVKKLNRRDFFDARKRAYAGQRTAR
jgi:hypothetical protein